MNKTNQDKRVVIGFGKEWQKFDQSTVDEKELKAIFDACFCIFPWHQISRESVGFDMGCGSGRWAKLVAPRVKKLFCVDPSADALAVAKAKLASFSNVAFVHASVCSWNEEKPELMDFGYSLGVLHHVPDTLAGIKSCAEKLKPGAPFLIYLYYALDNMPKWYYYLWKSTEIFRYLISRLPFPLRYVCSQIIAALVYWPLSTFSYLCKKIGFNISRFPLSAYHDKSFYTMRTDALDRFGTRLEQRFSKKEIKSMLEQAGFEKISFSEKQPFWLAIGYKKHPDSLAT